MTLVQIVILAWTISGAVFFGFALNGLLMARGDRILSERLQDREAARIIETREKRGLVRVVGFGCSIVVGITLMLDIDRGTTSVVMIAGLFVLLYGTGLEDVIDWLDRKRFRPVDQRKPEEV